MGSLDHFQAAALDGGVDAIAMADVLHYKRMSIGDIRAAALAADLPVRKV